MKKILSIAFMCAGLFTSAQQNINDLLAAGIDDAERYTNDYLAPAAEGLMYGMNNGWFNSAEVKPFLGFEISLIGNASPIKDNKKSFTLDTSQYENLQFVDGSVSKEVATALGDLQGIEVFVDGGQPGTFDDAVFELPSGLSAENIDFIPTAMLQASVGLIKHTEVKVRLLPKTSYDDASLAYYGFGLQHELSEWLPGNNLMPVAISGLIAYSHLNGEYDFTDTQIVDGENQRFETKADTWVFNLIASTKLPVINFYGSVGYLTGKSNTDILGTYVVEQGPLQSETVVDPFSIAKSASGVKATLGTKLKISFFRINADYTFGEFDSFNLGINFGFR
ncbi:hypothetical protein SAMN04487906_2318 [Zhouia amylolytica]|uniref:MetA-pathway of phenol degradation n=1 Tax=Zhouia amylolytica TaxID=376730 RepID=A0A1I6U2H2_9FLAO|nr:DUF6588 family protein [Zhouia amylolytica]SFS95477.1 hypothetical protein SAMN04487906_2318 [Zhouia amylolytica]